MPRRPPTSKHPRLDDIDQALRDGIALRPLSKQFGVSRSSLSRRAKAIGVDRQRVSLPSRSGTPPHPGTPDTRPDPSARPSQRDNQTPTPSDGDLFDIRSMAYPWAADEPRNPDALAARLRITQRLHGIPAVRDEILHLLGRYRGTQLAPHRLARMLDVPPAAIPQWLQAKDRLDRAALVATDPTDRTARDLAEIEDDLARVREHLANKEIGARSLATLMAQVVRLREQRAKLLDQAGLSPMVTRDTRDPQARDLHENIDELMQGFQALWAAIDASKTTQ
jgi:hypothetical protein